MMLLRKCIVINGLIIIALFGGMNGLIWAATPVGAVIHLSGPLFAKKPDGVMKVLSKKSSVEQGDTLISEKDTYALIRFIDNSEMTIKPHSQFKIEKFSFDESKPKEDSAVFNLVKGGLRAVTGILGKRNKEQFSLSTPTATIGIRGTIFIAEYIPEDEAGLAAEYRGMSTALASSSLLPLVLSDASSSMPKVADAAVPMNSLSEGATRTSGLYVQVLDGMVHVSNSAGTQDFSKGQFGYVSSMVRPPLILPANPGIQFLPPPSVPVAQAAGGANNHSSPSATNCEVR